MTRVQLSPGLVVSKILVSENQTGEFTPASRWVFRVGCGWLMLKKSKSVDRAFERVGVGLHTWYGNDPSYFNLFDEAEMTLKIV